MSLYDSLVLIVAGVVEREVGKATNESYGLIGAWCGLHGQRRSKKRLVWLRKRPPMRGERW